MTSGFMCYIKNGDTVHGTICSMYIHNEWYSDIHSRAIQLEFDIASTLAMRYLAFAISSNNYEWEVIHVQDSQNNVPADVWIPEEYYSNHASFKLGVKLYDSPPTVGSVLNVGFDYVITGGVTMASEANTKTISMSNATEGAIIRYTIDGSEPDETSTEYIGEIEVEIPCIIKAKAFKDSSSGETSILKVGEKKESGEIEMTKEIFEFWNNQIEFNVLVEDSDRPDVYSESDMTEFSNKVYEKYDKYSHGYIQYSASNVVDDFVRAPILGFDYSELQRRCILSFMKPDDDQFKTFQISFTCDSSDVEVMAYGASGMTVFKVKIVLYFEA